MQKLFINAMTGVWLATASAAAIGLAILPGCTTAPNGDITITGSSNLAQVAAQVLAYCQSACGVIESVSTVSDIQNLITTYLSAGAYATVKTVATAICAAIQQAKPQLRAGTARSVTVMTPGGAAVVHFSGVR